MQTLGEIWFRSLEQSVTRVEQYVRSSFVQGRVGGGRAVLDALEAETGRISRILRETSAQLDALAGSSGAYGDQARALRDRLARLLASLREHAGKQDNPDSELTDWGRAMRMWSDQPGDLDIASAMTMVQDGPGLNLPSMPNPQGPPSQLLLVIVFMLTWIFKKRRNETNKQIED